MILSADTLANLLIAGLVSLCFLAIIYIWKCRGDMSIGGSG